jgi:hypothetical protein
MFRLYAVAGAVLAVLFAGAAGAEVLRLDNGVVAVGVDLSAGGGITELFAEGDGRNLINNFDRGRQVQQSYYAGDPIDRTDEGQHPAWSPWPWNPITVGDTYGNASEVLESSNDGATIYVKTRPLLWDMNNEPAECHFESWVTLEANVVRIRNKLTTFRTDDRWNVTPRHQELPAVYTIGDLHNLYSYEGNAPYTKDDLTLFPKTPPPWVYWGQTQDTENWAAHVDNDDWGVGVYTPETELFVGGFVGTPGGSTTDNDTGYISPLRTLALEKDTVFEYRTALVVGNLEGIRAFAYNEEGHTDYDGDGLDYAFETRDYDPGTPGLQNPFDPTVADATGDMGLAEPDGIPDGQNDWDGDGATNAQEAAAGSDPLNAASDPEALALGATATAAVMALAGLVEALRS